jgi:hypothetical protein
MDDPALLAFGNKSERCFRSEVIHGDKRDAAHFPYHPYGMSE